MRTIATGIPLAGLLLCGVLQAQQGFAFGALLAPEPAAQTVIVSGAASGSYLGIGVAEIDAERARKLKLKEERGVEVTRVEEDSPASKAGLKTGDVILEYNGQRVEGTQQFVRMVRETPAGRQVRLLISRDGATQTITAAIGKREARGMAWGATQALEELNALGRDFRTPDIPQVFVGVRSRGLGIEAEGLTSQLAEYFGVKEGVLVRSVLRDTPAEKAGLKAGDVITKVDGASVAKPQDVTRALRASREKKTFPLTVVRNHKEMTISVTLAEQQPGPASQARGGALL